LAHREAGGGAADIPRRKETRLGGGLISRVKSQPTVTRGVASQEKINNAKAMKSCQNRDRGHCRGRK